MPVRHGVKRKGIDLDDNEQSYAKATKGKQRVQKAATNNKSEKQAMTANKTTTRR